jgi:hypothetical protein
MGSILGQVVNHTTLAFNMNSQEESPLKAVDSLFKVVKDLQ